MTCVSGWGGGGDEQIFGWWGGDPLPPPPPITPSWENPAPPPSISPIPISIHIIVGRVGPNTPLKILYLFRIINSTLKAIPHVESFWGPEITKYR